MEGRKGTGDSDGLLFGASCQAGAGHAFAQAAVTEKILFQPLDLPVEEITSHFDQANDDVGADGGVGVLDALFEGLVVGVEGAVELAEAAGMGVLRRPFLDVAGAHEIAIVFEEFFLAGAGNVGEFEFGFLGGAAGLAAFKDVLFAGAGGLHHLIVGAGAFADETVAEIECGLKNDQGFAIGKEILMAAMSGDEMNIASWRRRMAAGGGFFGRFSRFGLSHGLGL